MSRILGYLFVLKYVHDRSDTNQIYSRIHSQIEYERREKEKEKEKEKIRDVHVKNKNTNPSYDYQNYLHFLFL